MTSLTPPISCRDQIRGANTAAITLVEYGDFACPNCGEAYSVLKDMQQQFGDGLRFVFRYFPLTEVYPQAQHVAEAAQAAAAQGKFWEMHDCLFSNQQALGDGDLVDYAISLELVPPPNF